MDMRLRSYKGKRPQLGKRVYVDPCATLVGDIVLGEDASIWPLGAILLDGVVVEDDVMIGAGSLVPPGKRLASGFLYMGNPAKQARPLKPAEIAFLKTSADNYVLLKDEYLQEA